MGGKLVTKPSTASETLQPPPNPSGQPIRRRIATPEQMAFTGSSMFGASARTRGAAQNATHLNRLNFGHSVPLPLAVQPVPALYARLISTWVVHVWFYIETNPMQLRGQTEHMAQAAHHQSRINYGR
jgi:hypothetical protein